MGVRIDRKGNRDKPQAIHYLEKRENSKEFVVSKKTEGKMVVIVLQQGPGGNPGLQTCHGLPLSYVHNT